MTFSMKEQDKMTEWKPGMVAATEYRCVESRAFVVEGFSCPEGHPRRPHWHGMSGGWNLLDDTEATYRRLVVLDLAPGDLRCVVENLRSRATYMDGIGAPYTTVLLRDVADQIEQQIHPPKPAEPKGLGAVVEDARGDFWVYTGLRNAKDGETRLWFHGSLPADYADINAVKVLSEGVLS